MTKKPGRPSRLSLKQKVDLFLRKEQEGLTIQQLANIAGCSTQTISNWSAQLKAAGIEPGQPIPESLKALEEDETGPLTHGSVAFDIQTEFGNLQGRANIHDVIKMLKGISEMQKAD